MNLKLGRTPVRHDSRTLKLAKYLSPILTPPDSINWGQHIPSGSWGMMKNDLVGDCTCAGAGHMEMLWTSNASSLFIPTDDQILSAYSSITGYDASKTDEYGNNPTDNGANELDVLKYWQRNGIAGRKIGAFVSINPQNLNHLKIATWLFGAVYTGANLTQADMDSFNEQKEWSPTSNDYIGGHAFPIIGYDASGFGVVTWGAIQLATKEWVNTQLEEAYAVISPDWIANTGLAPSGFDIGRLITDLAAVQS